MSESSPRKPSNRFHGRVAGSGAACAHDGCDQPGEFRAPDQGGPGNGFDGPRGYRWLCFDHVREFNASYNFFDGMSREEIEEAQIPYSGWERETRAFARAGVDAPPSWADFHDPLDAISARFRKRRESAMPRTRSDGKPLSPADREALTILGLEIDADRRALRSRYSELVRRYHPDRNGGDRAHEKKLQGVVEAYQHLRATPAFS